MRVLLDTNVLLDSILQRPPWHKDADAILNEAALGRVTCAAASLSFATVFYVARKAVGISLARAAVVKSLTALEVLSVDKQTLLDADSLSGSDFEDNILIAAATAASVDAIVTRNPNDFTQSPVPVWEPVELLKRLSAGTPPPAGSAGSVQGQP